MTRFHLCGRALTFASLLIGVSVLPFSTLAFAQSALPQTSAPGSTATSPAAERSFAGVWAASPFERPGNKTYLEINSYSGSTISGAFWAVDSTGNRRVGDLSLQRVGPGHLTGNLVTEGRQGTSVTVLAPVGKDYLLLTLTRPYQKSVTYLRAVNSVGAAIPSLSGSAVTQAMLGDWHTPHGVLTIDIDGTMLRGIFRGPDGSVRARELRAYLPQAESHYWRTGSGDYDLTFVLSPDGKQFQVNDRHAQVGGLQNWVGNRVSSEPMPAPAPGPAPAPAPTPAPVPPVAEAPQVPGTVQAGTFHSLEAFDVRFDEARAGRDGRVQALFTVRNASGREQSFGAGALVAVMTDADGVGVRESQAYRATGDDPVLFSPSPTIPAGGQLRVRYLFKPPIVHGPLQRVSVREYGEKKLLTFALPASAGPGASPAPAPPPGGGSFKQLSQFDVRIDRVAPARDGKLEVFLTLRNPSNLLRSTSKGHIKLSGSDSDGAISTSVSALFSVRGERGRYDELPLHVHVEPRGEVRLRYIFDRAISGPITISDGTVSQTFTAG